MKDVLAWPPLLWTLRVLLLVAAGGGIFVTLLYMARFLRPRNVLALLKAELPAFQRVGGTAKLLGQELSLNAELDERRDLQFESMEQRFDAIVLQVEGLELAVGEILDTLHDLDESDD